MTVAPQGTLIQIFVELSKWGIGELPSWSVSRQVARRWLVMGRQHSGIQGASPKRLQVLDGALGVLRVEVRVKWKRKILGEGGTMVCSCSCLKNGGGLQPATGGCRDGAALCVPLPMALNSVRCWGHLPTTCGWDLHHLLGRDWDNDLRGDREEQGLQSQDSFLVPTWPLFSVLEVERVKCCMAARRGQTPHSSI